MLERALMTPPPLAASTCHRPSRKLQRQRRHLPDYAEATALPRQERGDQDGEECVENAARNWERQAVREKGSGRGGERNLRRAEGGENDKRHVRVA